MTDAIEAPASPTHHRHRGPTTMPITLATVRRFALALPDTTEEPHHHFGSFRVRGKIFVTIPPGGEHLHIFVPDDARDEALAAHPEWLEPVVWGRKILGVRACMPRARAAALKSLVQAAYAAKAANVSLRRPGPPTIDGYLAGFPPALRARLQALRETVRAEAPQAEETISYRMPTFKQNGVLVHFAAFQHHIGLYPPVRGDPELEAAAAPYAGEKGNLRFPHDEPLPLALIARITRWRLALNQAKRPGRPRSTPR